MANFSTRCSGQFSRTIGGSSRTTRRECRASSTKGPLARPLLETFGGACPGARRPFFPVTRRGGRHKRVDQPSRNSRDIIHRAVERHLVCLRRLRESRQLTDELNRRGANLLVSRRRIKVEERFDVSAHIWNQLTPVLRLYVLNRTVRR